VRILSRSKGSEYFALKLGQASYPNAYIPSHITLSCAKWAFNIPSSASPLGGE